MNMEGLEQMRYEFLQTIVASMTVILNDPKTSVDDKIKAGKLLDAISDTIVKAHLMTEVTGVEEKTRNKMINQLDKLTDDQNHEH